jgi:hypothetical protein
MNSSFQTISDAKYHFISDVNVRDAILKAGRKKIAFVEGYDDKVIFGIMYEENLIHVAFIDISTQAQNGQAGGCDKVKSFLKQCIENLPTNKCLFGIIDRDLNTDVDIETEKNLPCYDNRLFIFTERYTLENYFIEIDVLSKFIEGQSINHKGLIPLTQDEAKLTEIVREIILCMATIATANFTIRHFDFTQKFVEGTIDCAEDEIKKRISDRLNQQSETITISQINERFASYEEEVVKDDGLKFASAKDYFATQFNRRLKKFYGADLQLNNHKSDLARILKNKRPAEFTQLLKFMGLIDNFQLE